MAEVFVCVACGTHYPPAVTPPPHCPICVDERQFIPAGGQQWTTADALVAQHAVAIRREGDLIGLGISPSFGIGQRALLLRTPHGNVLWDCIALIDPVILEIVAGLGGLCAIAISHPHYYTAMRAWSRAFGNVPVHLHERDRRWVMDPGPELVFWGGETAPLLPGTTLIRAGGHFAGGTVLHWAEGAGGAGAVLAGDILQVGADRRTLGFMRSYPNYIPLGAAAVMRIANVMAPWSFAAIYGAFFDRVITANGRVAFDYSIRRHLDYLGAGADDD